ncbi:MAG: ABC transporter ATP-binding protein [Chloroflexi bacterium]|nr:ABC transporter ATP-binding protein [Chloroflexota bacterium]
MSNTQQLSKTSIQSLLQNARWTLVYSWQTNRRLMVALIMVTFVWSLVPAGLALSIRGLINAITAVFDGTTTSSNEVMLWLGIGLGITLVEVISSFADRYLDQRLTDEINLRVTTDILQHAAQLDLAYFEDPAFQDMMAQVQNNIARRFALFINKILSFTNNSLQMASLTAILVVIEPLVLLVLVVIAVPYLLLQWRLAKSRYSEEFFRITKMRWTTYFVQRLTQQQWVPESKLLNLAPLFVQKFHALMSEFRDQNKAIHGRVFAGSSLFAGISSIAFFVTFARVALRVVQGSLTLGDVAIYGGATGRLRSALENTILALTTALEQTMHIANLRKFFAIEPHLDKEGGKAPDNLLGNIQVKALTFTYPGAKKPTLKNVSLAIKPGETVAIVGQNGAGKTTLAKLLARLYDPDSGAILFDDIDLREMPLAFLHQQVSFVFQQYGRFEATAADNIAYGDWERLLDKPDAIKKVAELAGVDQLINEMPDGFDTMLGRMFGEYTISGGQWQKIAIARAFARPSTLLILDEPSSNLDAINEYKLFSRFTELADKPTTILISHRFSTVSMAERIFVMDKGKIVECGTHDDLLAVEGKYAQMYAHHKRKFQGPK